MSAQLKPNERAALEVKLANRRSDVFEIERAKVRDVLEEELQQTVSLFMHEIMKNYQTGDDCSNGQILGNCIAGYALRIESARVAKEMREEREPSFRSRCEP